MHRYVHHERSDSEESLVYVPLLVPSRFAFPLLPFERNFSIIRWNVHLIDQSLLAAANREFSFSLLVLSIFLFFFSPPSSGFLARVYGRV